MSLDVYLIEKVWVSRDKGKTYEDEEREVYNANITHNLNTMADVAGVYYHIWRPEEIGITTAKELIMPLTKAIQHMKAHPEIYEQYDSPNGWGIYMDFVPWIERYRDACVEYPEATIKVSR